MASEAEHDSQQADGDGTAHGQCRHARVRVPNKKYIRTNAACTTGSRRKMLELEARLSAIQQQYEKLTADNETMRKKETMLASAVSQQSAMLHHLAKASMVLEGSQLKPEGCEALLHSLRNDVVAHDILNTLGATSKDQLYTNEMFGEVATPERLAQLCGITVQQLAQQCSALTMRMAFMLSMDPSKASMMQESLGSVVDEFTALIILSNIVAPRELWELAAMNMETLQHMTPAKEHWVKVNAKSQLSEEQIQQLCVCFQVYTTKRAAVIANIKQHVQQLEQLGQAQHERTGAAAAATAELRFKSPFSGQQAVPFAAAAVTVNQRARTFGMNFDTSRSNTTGNDSGNMPHSSSHGGSGSSLSKLDVSSGSASLHIAAAPVQAAAAAGIAARLSSTQQQEVLLKQIAQGVSLLQSLEMFLSFKWINTLSKQQLAYATVEAYPFLCFPASICEALLESHKPSAV